LENKKIPLRVRSFLQPELPGTLIADVAETEKSTPSFIVKNNQMLISLSPKDFSFIAEKNLRDIFAAFAKIGIRVNMMQNSAISFTACISQNERKVENLFDILETDFKIKYNKNLQLVTIRNWNAESIEQMTAGKTLLLEQRNRTTAQMVFKITSEA
jgi:aspartate kinase